ncbi:hypothetical protein C0991_002609 [Blastosporella zonata]|nr:hypothetical protein C0991_002609 [Blastosporella zonata]
MKMRDSRTSMGNFPQIIVLPQFRSITDDIHLRCADDVRVVPPGPESHSVQTSGGHLRELHTADDFPAIDLRVPRAVHPVQVVHRLVADERGAAVPAEHADRDVPVARDGEAGAQAVFRAERRADCAVAPGGRVRALAVDYEAVYRLERDEPDSASGI